MNKIWTRRTTVLVLLLLFVFIGLNISSVWRWMYPVYYPETIKSAGDKYELNPNLILAIIQTESRFVHHQTSKKGAIGLMQIMSDTANWIVERAGYSEETKSSLHDPRVNIELGSWYLRYLLNLFDNNLIAALAAYNAGQGNVDKWLTTGVWDGQYDTMQRIPFGETRHYIQRVLYIYERYEAVYGKEYWK